jgi:hypothetical protein
MARLLKGYGTEAYVSIENIAGLRIDGGGSSWFVVADMVAAVNGSSAVTVSSTVSTQGAAQAKADSLAASLGLLDLG